MLYRERGVAVHLSNLEIEDEAMSSTITPADAAIKSLLVAYDFSDASRKPLQHALAVARHFQAKLYIAYVVSSIGYTITGPEAAQLVYEGSVRDARRLEAELLEGGSLAGLEYEFIVREGIVWDQLAVVIQQKHVDAVVVGTHAREGLDKLVLGSIAEQIFRQADCLVLTVGPGAREDSLIEKKGSVRPFLFPTDFGDASLCALRYATSFASHFRTDLIVLHVLPAAPIPSSFHWSTTGGLEQMRDQAQLASRRQFEELIVAKVPGATKMDFIVRFGIPSEQILQACHSLQADLLILGLHSAKHAETESHLPWLRAHEIVCGASCPVLTLKEKKTGALRLNGR